MIKVTCHKGMVNIDSDNIAYSNIKNMYKNSDGIGLQLNEKTNRDKITAVCNDIADKLYQLEELLNETG